MPNPSLEPTHYGRHRLAAPGLIWYCPYAAKRRLPPRSSQLERYASEKQPNSTTAYKNPQEQTRGALRSLAE